MTTLVDFKEPGAENDRVVQMALREIDTALLARAMVEWSEEEQEIIYRNMTERAVILLKEEMAHNGPATSERESSGAVDFFVQKLLKYRKYAQSMRPGTGPLQRPVLDTSNPEAIVESFTAISRFAIINGFVALEGIEEDTQNPVARKGLELAIDGWEPMLVRTILERMKAHYLSRVEQELDMIIDGVDNLISGVTPIVVHQVLQAYIE
ncbi:MAG: hypothetical protein KAU31_04770 [Spirochaetaceae bacterium]|nr:hypothetical protein [Spirochaetaceae bacterium]